MTNSLSLPAQSLGLIASETTVTNLLWTGGFDSTYRLIELVVDSDCVIQPWYLLDEERKSVPREIEAMNQILNALRSYPLDGHQRLRPTRTVSVASLAEGPDLTAMASRLRLGSQYDWLARFAREYDLDGLELGIEDRPGRVQEMLRPLLVELNGPGGRTFRINPEGVGIAYSNADVALFSQFSFPIIRKTKQDMLDEARSRGWEPILAQTWFCHSPKKGRPCGCCDPCMIALKSGMSARIPISRRLRPRLRFLSAALRERLGSG